MKQARVGRDPIALEEQQDVPWHELACVDHLPLPVPANGRLLGQVAAQRLDGSLCLPLLRERERRVEEDDGDDRGAERRHAGDEGEGGGRQRSSARG